AGGEADAGREGRARLRAARDGNVQVLGERAGRARVHVHRRGQRAAVGDLDAAARAAAGRKRGNRERGASVVVRDRDRARAEAVGRVRRRAGEARPGGGARDQHRQAAHQRASEQLASEAHRAGRESIWRLTSTIRPWKPERTAAGREAVTCTSAVRAEATRSGALPARRPPSSPSYKVVAPALTRTRSSPSRSR